MNKELPLTERILAHLPGSRIGWIFAWGALTLFRPLIFSGVLLLTGARMVTWEFLRPLLISHAVLAYMVVLALLLERRFAQAIRSIEPAIVRLTEDRVQHEADPFRGQGSVKGPLMLTLFLTLVLTTALGVRSEPSVAVLMAPFYFVVNLPLMAFFWGYIMMLIGLDRLGRRKLELNPFPEDPGLGLRPIGALAAMGFWAFCAETVPYLLMSMRSQLDLIIGLIVFLIGVGVFFLSLTRIHRQMVGAKQRYLAWTRGLYAQAFEPVKPAPTLEALKAQAPLLSAAEALEKRAAMVQEWPFDERTNSRIVVIVTGAIVATIARLVLRSLGL